MTFLTVFMWLCLALFAAAAVIWLLDMVGVLTIRSNTQRTMLNASLGTTLLGGMASFAVGAFFTTPGEAEAPAAPADAPTITPPAASTGADNPDAAPKAERKSDPAPEPAACTQFDHPPRLAEWGSAALGTPPTFRCPAVAPYPACLEELRSRSRDEISRESARACGDDLLAFRRAQISPAYAAKISYQDNLDAAEASLRNPRNVIEEDRKDYVVAEIARMNGSAWSAFTALDQRSRGDMLACQSDRQRCLAEP